MYKSTKALQLYLTQSSIHGQTSAPKPDQTQYILVRLSATTHIARKRVFSLYIYIRNIISFIKILE